MDPGAGWPLLYGDRGHGRRGVAGRYRGGVRVSRQRRSDGGAVLGVDRGQRADPGQSRGRGVRDGEQRAERDAQRDQLRILYGFDDIEVGAVFDAGSVSYNIAFVRAQAGIDFAPIVWAETGNTTGLLPSAGASASVVITTVRNGALVAGLNKLQTVEVNATNGWYTLSFLLPDAAGGVELATTEPIFYNATALDVYKALSRLLNPNGSTIDIDEQFDRDSRNPALPFTDNVAVSQHGNVFEIVFQGAYAGLEIFDIDTSNLVGTARSARVTVSGVSDGGAIIDGATALTATLVLSGTAVMGEEWTLALTVGGNSTRFAYRAAGGESAASIAAQIAGQVNQRAGAGFRATSDGETLVIVNTVGTLFRAGFSITGATPRAVVADTAARTMVVDLSG